MAENKAPQNQQDEELTVDELSTGELEEVAGGANTNCGGNCGCTAEN